MAVAFTLQQAAGQAFERLDFFWKLDLLKAKLLTFWQDLIKDPHNIFPEQDQGGHPVANWLAIIAAQQNVMPATDVPIEQLSASVEAVYKCCWIADYLSSIGQITTDQAAAVLNIYNLAFFIP